MARSNLSAAQTPLLDDTVDACLDYKGRPVRRSNTGGWRSSSFILAVEIAERFAYYGISSNLIIYLTGPLGESTASAAAQLNAWSGAVSLLPLLGAFIADSFLGRYRTIILSSMIYILGLGLLTLSATLTSVGNSADQNSDNVTLSSSLRFQVTLFFVSLYLVAFGQGGFKPCVQAFGADQFDRQDPEECQAQRSFFNWWFFGTCVGATVTIWILPYIQDNLSWVLGFGLPAIVLVVVLVVFVFGTPTYRFCIQGNEESPFVRIGRVFILAVRNRKNASAAMTADEEDQGTIQTESFKQFKFLNKALLVSDGSKEQGMVCSISEVEEAKTVLRLVPIWSASLIYAVAYAQSSTFFTKQGATMDRTLTPGFQIPAASLESFISLTIVLFIPIYDRIFVPLARTVTGRPSGITMLQRIGPGMLLSVTSMLTAASVEKRRLKTAQEYGLLDKPNVTVPMSVWWLAPQYILFGLSEVFTLVGLQELFYDQVPKELRSVGLALYSSIFGVGSFLSSFLISTIENITGGDDQDSWFANNLNQAHLDYYYWLLAALSAIGLSLFLCCTKSYIYARGSAL